MKTWFGVFGLVRLSGFRMFSFVRLSDWWCVVCAVSEAGDGVAQCVLEPSRALFGRLH